MSPVFALLKLQVNTSSSPYVEKWPPELETLTKKKKIGRFRFFKKNHFRSLMLNRLKSLIEILAEAVALILK